MAALETLKASQINSALRDRPRPGAKPVKRMLADGGSLYLQITATGSSWVFRFKKDGRLREMGLGSYPDVSLTQARGKAREYRAARREYEDPIEARQAKRLAERAAKGAVTFKWCAERYIAAHEKGWRSARHREQWGQSLAAYAYPVIGELGVAAVDTGLVMRVVEPLWANHPETASRVRSRIELVLDWAAVRGHRAGGDNPARWRGHLDKLLPRKSKVAAVKHFEAVGIDEVAELVERLRAIESVVARALEFTILTAVRTNEVLQAQWGEINLEAGVWTAPAAHTKGGRDRRTPLSEAAVATLRRMDNLKGYSDFVFPGSRRGRGIAAPMMLRLLKGVRPGATVHGMRSTFRDWASERTGHDRDAVEIALSHAVGDATERAYRRGDLLEKRRALMDEWGRFVTGAG